MTQQAQRRTRAEIENLKAQWATDPIWDLEDTEGFEAHREELAQYAEEMIDKWDREYAERLRQKADDLGVPGNSKLALYVIRLEERIANLEAKHV